MLRYNTYRCSSRYSSRIYRDARALLLVVNLSGPVPAGSLPPWLPGPSASTTGVRTSEEQAAPSELTGGVQPSEQQAWTSGCTGEAHPSGPRAGSSERTIGVQPSEPQAGTFVQMIAVQQWGQPGTSG